MTFPHTWACIANLSWVCPPTEPKPSVSYPHDTHTLYPIKKNRVHYSHSVFHKEVCYEQGCNICQYINLVHCLKCRDLIGWLKCANHQTCTISMQWCLPSSFPNILSSKSKEKRNFLFHVLKFAKSFTTIRSTIYRFPFNLSSPPPPNNFCWINKFSILFKLHTFAGNWPSISRRKLSIFFLLSSSTDAQIDQISENKNHSSIMRG